jgi:hypothetical protein
MFWFQQLQDVPQILRHNLRDAIAFERGPNRKVSYIYELPPSVNDRLSEYVTKLLTSCITSYFFPRSFRDGMKNLLCSMLKLDPREQMTSTEFFENVDDII